MEYNKAIMILLSLIAILQLVWIVKTKIRISYGVNQGEGWYEIRLTEDVYLRMFNDSMYWKAKQDIIPENVIDEGRFAYDRLNWVRYSTMKTRDQYEESILKYAQRCGCTDCQSILKEYEVQKHS